MSTERGKYAGYFLIWHSDRLEWFLPKAQGYTSDLSNAGEFTGEKAESYDCEPYELVRRGTPRMRELAIKAHENAIARLRRLP